MKIGDLVIMSEPLKQQLRGSCYSEAYEHVVHTGIDPLYPEFCHNCSYDHLNEFEYCIGIIYDIGQDGFADVRWQPSNLRYGYEIKYLLPFTGIIKNKYFVYIVECADKTLYTGITNNLIKRINLHNSSKGAKYTKGRGPVIYKRIFKCLSKTEALQLESKIKKLSKKDKLKYIP